MTRAELRRICKPVGISALVCILLAAMWLRWIAWRETAIKCIEHGADARWCLEHTR